MGEIRVVLIFNEDNERQREIGRYLKSQKRCKTALITELVYAWLHKENAPVSSYNNANVSVEELKQQLLQDTDFIQQIKKSVVIEEDAGKVIENLSEPAETVARTAGKGTARKAAYKGKLVKLYARV